MLKLLKERPELVPYYIMKFDKIMTSSNASTNDQTLGSFVEKRKDSKVHEKSSLLEPPFNRSILSPRANQKQRASIPAEV